jgi:pSer/pThr/pTyr-binding forkhead associated (FHA) protein
MSVYCSQGHENPDGSAFCEQCGEALQPAANPAPAMASATPDASAAPSTPDASSAPAAAGAPKLIIESDNATFDLAGKSEALIGREDPISNIYPDVDLTPHGGEEGGVSRMHAKLYIQGTQYLIEDLNSTNFTFVNRQKLTPKNPTPIKDGDEVRFGRVVAKFVTA